MSPNGEALELTGEQISRMVTGVSRVTMEENSTLHVVASDSYGPHLHRTWVFFSTAAEMVGSIERYWSGIKMICSVSGGNPRTFFFTEDGNRSTNKGLKGQL